jgi:hypothetical protein
VAERSAEDRVDGTTAQGAGRQQPVAVNAPGGIVRVRRMVEQHQPSRRAAGWTVRRVGRGTAEGTAEAAQDSVPACRPSADRVKLTRVQTPFGKVQGGGREQLREKGGTRGRCLGGHLGCVDQRMCSDHPRADLCASAASRVAAGRPQGADQQLVRDTRTERWFRPDAGPGASGTWRSTASVLSWW